VTDRIEPIPTSRDLPPVMPVRRARDEDRDLDRDRRRRERPDARAGSGPAADGDDGLPHIDTRA
jgi:hypothetical protein